MKAPLTTTLFTEPSDYSRSPASYATSAIVHVAIISLIVFGVFYNPPILVHTPRSFYTVRDLDLEMPPIKPHHSPAEDLPYPGAHKPVRALASSGAQSQQSLVMPPVPEAKRAPQTLIQPDVHTDIALAQEAPLPQIVMWTPAKMPLRNIVPPTPSKPPTQFLPRLTHPNQEPNLGNIAIASTEQPSLKQLVVPSNTTPISVHGPPQPATVPSTVTQNTAKPTPAAVVSLSDIKMRNGSVALPPVNQAAKANSTGDTAPMPGPPKPVPTQGNSAAGNQPAGNGTSGTHPGEGSSNNNNNTASSGTANKSTVAGSDQGDGMTGGTGQGEAGSVTAISLPKEGKFGAVIVGNSLQDEYPEIGDVWKGRMAYTVYLHVGLTKNWILQYALPGASDSAQTGTVAQLEAPWPYNIVRPNFSPDALTADALMVHGFVNIAGRFERLSIVFPDQFPQAQFVLESLARWQFRPASENGQIAKVEVLIIIPEQFE